MSAELPRPSLGSAQGALTDDGTPGAPFLTDEALFGACGVRVAFFGREGGVSEGAYASLNTGGHVEDDLALVRRNRELALSALGFGGVPVVVPKVAADCHPTFCTCEEMETVGSEVEA